MRFIYNIKALFKIRDGDTFFFKENGSLSISPESFFYKTFLTVLKMSKTFVFFLRTSVNIKRDLDNDPVLRSVIKDPL